MMSRSFNENFFGTILLIVLLLSCNHPKKANILPLHENKCIKTPQQNKKIFVQPTAIHVLDTLINMDRIRVNWYSDGKVEFDINQNIDSIKWFPYDELSNRLDHSSIILKDKNRPAGIVINDSIIIFSLTDFKGRAVLFMLNRLLNGNVKFAKASDKCLNPIINESPYAFVDLKNNLVINNGGRHRIDDDSISNSYDIYTYKLLHGCWEMEGNYQSTNKKFMNGKRFDLSQFQEAKKFYYIILSERN